jgi:hypothetical protein
LYTTSKLSRQVIKDYLSATFMCQSDIRYPSTWSVASDA